MSTKEKSEHRYEQKLLIVMSYYNKGYSIQKACKMASLSLHTYYQMRKTWSQTKANESGMIKNDPSCDSVETL